MIKESSNKYSFSFLVRNAIQEILIELNTISMTETTKNVVIINERLSSLKKLSDMLARIKKTSIVLK
jgi:phosphopantothenate synthetase